MGLSHSHRGFNPVISWTLKKRGNRLNRFPLLRSLEFSVLKHGVNETWVTLRRDSRALVFLFSSLLDLDPLITESLPPSRQALHLESSPD